MNKIQNILYQISLSLSLLLLVISCSNDEPTQMPSDLMPLSINMRIEGSGSATTRVVTTTTDDQWSITDFTPGDKMGLYASGGNWLENGNQNTPFNNEELIYNGDSQFNSPEGMTAFSPSGMKGNEVYMYFPYCEEMSTTGLELRKMAPDNSIRCLDFLSASTLTMDGYLGGTHTALFGTFQHSFSELIIMRGEGFDNPPESTANTDYSRITAVINTGVTHIKVNFSMENGWSCVPELVYQENSNFVNSEREAKEWDAWKGGNYGITQLDPEGKEAWYVIVPTLKSNRSIVEYIELYNNDGQFHLFCRHDIPDKPSLKRIDCSIYWPRFRHPHLVASLYISPNHCNQG